MQKITEYDKSYIEVNFISIIVNTTPQQGNKIMTTLITDEGKHADPKQYGFISGCEIIFGFKEKIIPFTNKKLEKDERYGLELQTAMSGALKFFDKEPGKFVEFLMGLDEGCACGIYNLVQESKSKSKSTSK